MGIHLAVTIGPTALLEIVDSLSASGWEAEPDRRQGEQLRLTHTDLPRVDCLLATTDFERAAIDRAVTAEIGRRRIRVLTPEDLIVYKLVAGRARDYEAVAAIINARGARLDADYITGWLDQFGFGERWARALEEAERERG
jgi:hypothetical protein